MDLTRFSRNSFIVLLVLVTLAALAFNLFQTTRAPQYSESINQVLADAQRGSIERIETQGSRGDLLITYKDEPGVKIHSRMEPGDSITRLLLSAGVPLDSIDIVVGPPPASYDLIALMGTILPFLLIGALFFLLLRRQSGVQVTKNLARYSWKIERQPTVPFTDVGGLGEAKQAVTDIIAYLKAPNRFGELGAHLPRAILVQGPPGVGKSLFVRAVAGEAGVKLIYCSSSEFIEVFVGLGAARLRDLFEQARQLAPVIIFIDELDAVGRTRVEPDRQFSTSEQQLLLSRLFLELDQLNTKRGVVVFAATNRPDLVDPALLRAGRLERQITLGLPSEAERLEILKILVRGKPLARDVRLEEIADRTAGRTGADLATIVNQAALAALKSDRPASGRTISYADLEQALDGLRVTA